jgi:lysyl-tRNA synthetase class 2
MSLLRSPAVFVREKRAYAEPFLDPREQNRLREKARDPSNATNDLSYVNAHRDDRLFVQGGDAIAAFRDGWGSSIATDLLGPREDWGLAMEQHKALAKAQGLTPAWFGVTQEVMELGVQHGYRAMYLGDMPVLKLEDFTLTGRDMRNLRQSYNRVAKQEYKSEIKRVSDLNDDEVAQLTAVHQAWLKGKGGNERGFSMELNRIADKERDPNAIIVYGYTALDEGTKDERRKIDGFLQLLPGPDGRVSYDLMPALPKEQGGVAGMGDFLVTEAAQRLKGEPWDVKEMSLNFLVLSEVMQAKKGAPIWMRSLRRTILCLPKSMKQMVGLAQYNKKFFPGSEPFAKDSPHIERRYCLYLPHGGVVPAGLAVASFEGYL